MPNSKESNLFIKERILSVLSNEFKTIGRVAVLSGVYPAKTKKMLFELVDEGKALQDVTTSGKAVFGKQTDIVEQTTGVTA